MGTSRSRLEIERDSSYEEITAFPSEPVGSARTFFQSEDFFLR
jgi:hypothetical protein